MTDNTNTTDPGAADGARRARRTPNPGELTGAYALHALDAGDGAVFEAHLAESEEARIEAAELSDTAVALGLATAPVQPSAGLKAALMARLATTPQLAPLTTPGPTLVRAAPSGEPATDAPAGSRTPAPLAAGPATPSPVTTGTPPESPGSAPSMTVPSAAVGPATVPSAGPASAEAPAAAPASTAAPASSAAERARKRWFQRPVAVLLAAAVAAALFVGGTVVGRGIGGTGNSFEAQQAAGLAQLNAASDVRRASTTTADGQKATLVWSDDRKLSALLVDDLPALPTDKDYQLWYIGPGGAVSAGTFSSSGTGTVWRVLDGTLSAGDTIGMTVEPKGGSKQPTTDPIVAIQSS